MSTIQETLTVAFEEQVEIPMTLRSLADFRRWALSEEFPECGRIDYITGRIEVDMSPEDLFFHGTPKTEIIGVLRQRNKRFRRDYLFSDRMRISETLAGLSAEPDIVFVTFEAIRDGRVRLVPKATGEPGRYVEIEGGPDVMVEIVSDSSVLKDTLRLPPAYFAAGVREFWLVDARRDELIFRIHRRGEEGFEAVEPDGEGFQWSEVFGCRYRLERQPDELDGWEYGGSGMRPKGEFSRR